MSRAACEACEAFLNALFKWLRRQRFDDPGFGRMALSGAIQGPSRRRAVLKFSASRNAYLGFWDLRHAKHAFGAWATVWTGMSHAERETALARHLRYLPPGRCYQKRHKASNVIHIETEWGKGDEYPRLGSPAVRKCLFTFALHALRFCHEVLEDSV